MEELRFYFKIQWGHDAKLSTINVTEKGLGRLAIDVAKFCLENAKGANPELVILRPEDSHYNDATDDNYEGFLVW